MAKHLGKQVQELSAASETYKRFTEHTDPSDPIVAVDIQKGIRMANGHTDIQAHLPRLKAAARGNVLEIGVRYGASTSALLSGLEENGGHLWSIDVNDCSLFSGHPLWTFIQGDSKSIDPRIPAKLDLLFIDGDHSYEGCLSDLKLYGPRAEVVMLHDYGQWDLPVNRAIETYFDDTSCRHKTMMIYPESHNLAVLQ